MVDNPFNGLYMHVNFEEREWSGGYITRCALCDTKLIYSPDLPENVPHILTHIDNAALDEDKYFCGYNCLEDWLNEYVVKFI